VLCNFCSVLPQPIALMENGGSQHVLKARQSPSRANLNAK